MKIHIYYKYQAVAKKNMFNTSWTTCTGFNLFYICWNKLNLIKVLICQDILFDKLKWSIIFHADMRPAHYESFDKH